jgi:ABC-type sugar transport system substrate-binding protein
MLGTALEFAPGTTEDCQRLVTRLFQQPGAVLGAYRTARQRFGTSDLVLVTAEADPSGFEAMVRGHYVATLRRGLGARGTKMLETLGLAHKSAHQVASLPKDSDAFWLVVNRKDMLPVMVVLFAAPYATDKDAREPLILS